MALEVWYASPRDCNRFLRDFPSDGRDGRVGNGRRAPRQEAVQRQVARRPRAGKDRRQTYRLER